MKTKPVVALCGFAIASVCFWGWYQAGTETAAPGLAVSPPAQVPAPASRAVHDSGPDDPVTGASARADCTIVRHYLPKADGTTLEALSCERDSALEAHPYERYSSAALETLAYADPEAAEILGMRLIEDDEAASLSLIIRASALSAGDTAPIRRYSHAYPRPVVVDGVPQREAVRVKFVLSAVTALLAEDSAAPNPWEPVIREHSADPNRELALLHARAAEIVEEMQRIQVDVFGTSTIGGPGDA